MSWIDSIRRTAHRVDVHVAWALAVRFTPLVALVLATLYAFSADELLELVSEQAQSRLQELAVAVENPDATARRAAMERLMEEVSEEGASFVVLDPSGIETVRGGVEVDRRRMWRVEDLLLGAVRLSENDALLFERVLSDRTTLQLIVGTHAFVRERGDIQRAFWISLALGVLLVAAASLPATRRALRPLRQATRVTEAVDPQRLDTRIPVRGTGDDVDRHAVAVNRLLDRLEVGFDRLQAFTHDIAHELRTPVNRVLNVSEVALMEERADRRLRESWEQVRDTAGEMRRLIESLLFLAESAEAGFNLEGRHIEMSEIFRTLDDLYEPVCDERGVTLEVQPVEGTVRGDPALLLRALGNLLDNALAHTPLGGRIRVAGSREADGVTISVVDSGGGIPIEARERVFERFVRLDPSRSRGGSGLGLPIARAVARAHGGDLWVDTSREPGACFRLQLPWARRVGGSERSAAGPDGESAGAGARGVQG